MFISKKHFRHIQRAAGDTYMELQRTEAELAEVKQDRDLARACAAGYENMVSEMDKEIKYYKDLYEREVKKNAKCRMQNAELWKRLLDAISADQIEKEGLANEADD